MTIGAPRIGLILTAALLAASCGRHEKNKGIIDISHEDERPSASEDSQEALNKIIRRIQHGELPKIQFDFDSDVVHPASYPTLDAIADFLLGSPKIKLVVLAHTCDVGAADYNLDLSERRARSVKAYLVKRAVPPPSIRYHGMGATEPVADNSTEAGREKNRRVELRLVRRDWPSVY